MVEMDTMDMDGENTDVPLDEDTGIEPFLTFLPPYILCNTTNYTKLPLCNNDTKLVEENQHFEYAFIVAIVVPIIFGIIVLVGLFGNTLVVIVIIANKQMRSTTNYLIFRLVHFLNQKPLEQRCQIVVL
ncbi:uncharacterized protein LOC126992576 [Eriocheir sinensis]|uniref:uncharacterized protein LOC126992576 n=1 Tax=Eriocheir sinensis TaxID=95602 RepID=UPI0021C9E2BA|nr:uncharacterized protein LOC126992576 [Eriocheir sinensis]